jgi:hydrogenase maturation protease
VPDDDNRILVLGIGNPLMRDEGAGVRVVEMLLDGYAFPPNVEVIDAGTMGLTILDLLRDIDRLLVIDAVTETGHPAGTVLALTPEEIAPNSVMHSLHDTRLIDVLQAAELMDLNVEALCVGIQIESMDQWVLELSEPVEAALPVAASAALDVLRSWGVEPSPKSESNVDAAIIRALRTYEPIDPR